MNDIVLVSKRDDFAYRPSIRINGTVVEYFECNINQEDGMTVAELRIPVRSVVTVAEEEGELMTSVRKALDL